MNTSCCVGPTQGPEGPTQKHQRVGVAGSHATCKLSPNSACPNFAASTHDHYRAQLFFSRNSNWSLRPHAQDEQWLMQTCSGINMTTLAKFSFKNITHNRDSTKILITLLYVLVQYLQNNVTLKYICMIFLWNIFFKYKIILL